MPANEWYKNWFESSYYHKLYFERDETEAGIFIDKLLHYLKPEQNSRILDIGSGKGKHSKIFAEKGFNVTGVDMSVDNVQYANQFQDQNLHFYLHDIRLPFWINYFNYAFNLYTSFGYYATRREHDNAVRTIASSLKPSGVVVFDYLNTHYAEENLVHNEVKVIGETTYEIHRWHDDTHFFKKMIITDPHEEAPLTFTEKVAKFSLGDFNDMLSFNKMQITDVFGNYNLEAYDVSKTPRMIIAAKKLS